MDLLSAAQRAQIRAAIRDVSDTFHKSTVTYMLNVDSVDRFNEDRADTEYETYELPCMVEYLDMDRDKVNTSADGSVNRAEVQLQILYDKLIPMGLTTVDNGVRFDQTKDKFIHKGQTYIVSYVGLDGPMEDANLLVNIYGLPEVTQP